VFLIENQFRDALFHEVRVMEISVIGTGYVGLVSGTCFAEMGHAVTCIDVDAKKIETLKNGHSPIYEPGLDEMLQRNIASKGLLFSTNLESIKKSKAIFLAVGTPSDESGKADLKYLLQATRDLVPHLVSGSVLVIKSTVPVGTHKKLQELLAEAGVRGVDVVNNPEFLKEGAAIDDFMNPDRIVIGASAEGSYKVMDELYRPLMDKGFPMFHMSNLSAEMTKYAANCFLAAKISFINEIARLCDLTGADIDEVRSGITSDRRIGPHFLNPGPGYGGSCFPKDVLALIQTAKEYGGEMQMISAADEVNIKQKSYMFHKMDQHFSGDFANKTIAIWGVAFKADTDDIREASAITIVEELLARGANIQFYDPVASTNFLGHFKNHPKSSKLKSIENPYETLKGAMALVIMTEWKEFKKPDWNLMKKEMSNYNLFDARNLVNVSEAKNEGFFYTAFGRRV
jgi:UDPglucose 6-dehydrogenase